MSDLRFDIDIDSISSSFGEMKKELQKDLKKAVGGLAAMTHAKTLELANNDLKSLSKTYKDGVSFQQLEENLWVISLDEKVLWIEEGRKCIVYGKNSSHIPKILTPDGEIPITKVKKGMLVLNQHGKWTEVVEIYDEHLVEKSKLKIEEIKACRYAPNNNKLNKREYSIGFIATCSVCDDTSYHLKINKKRRNGSYCTKCLEKQEVYKVEISGSLNKQNSSNWSTMYLTGDHKVMTQDGWKEIRDFKKDDSFIVPSWSKCKACKKDALCGKDFCYDNEGGKCSSSFNVQKTLKLGKHHSQQPDSRANYLKKLQTLQKTNKTEDKFEEYLKNAGYSVGIYPDLSKDFVREYPISVKSDGKNTKKTYFIDFYSKKLNLGIEIDGAAFHCAIRDEKRDKSIKETKKIQIIRIPAKKIWKKNFLEEALAPILKNHSGEIKMMPFKAVKVSIKKLKTSSPINRRWDITVKDGESFICNKILVHNSGFMEELLNGKSSKTGKDGQKYAVIPFEHSKNPSEQSNQARELTNQIKTELKKRDIPYKNKLEYNQDGSPKLGLLHRFNIESARLKDTHKDSPLKGVAIYQKMNEKTGKVQRDVMTFRVISEKHRSEGKWVHPGRVGSKLMDKAFEWAMTEFDTKILPEVLGKYV